MINLELISQLYDEAKVNYELAENDWLLSNDIDYMKEMCIHSGEMLAYGNLTKNYYHYDYISPIDNNKIDNEALGNHLELERTAYYMGKDIEQVILCDAILMCPGWENSKGCKVEKFTAETYGKEVLYKKRN